MLANLAIECVAVNAEDLRGLRLISMSVGERSLDEKFLELVQCVVEVDAALDHFGHKGFQLIVQNFVLQSGRVVSIVDATSVPTRGSRQEISLLFRRESVSQ